MSDIDDHIGLEKNHHNICNNYISDTLLHLTKNTARQESDMHTKSQGLE